MCEKIGDTGRKSKQSSTKKKWAQNGQKNQKNRKEKEKTPKTMKSMCIPGWKRCREIEESWRTILYTKSAKNSKTTKKGQKIENKERKHLKERNQSAYLGTKNVGRWKRAAEQCYQKESAKNTQKNQKTPKEAKTKGTNT